MRTQPVRARVRMTALAFCGAAVVAAAAPAALASHVPPRAAGATRIAVAASRLPVVVNCAMHAQTKPGSYILACADGNSGLARLTWASWGTSAAFGSGTYTFNDCVPSCVAGHSHSFPALVALWGAKPWPGHAGQQYFTMLTVIFTGTRTYRAGGHEHRLPQTETFPLSPHGGA